VSRGVAVKPAEIVVAWRLLYTATVDAGWRPPCPRPPVARPTPRRRLYCSSHD